MEYVSYFMDTYKFSRLAAIMGDKHVTQCRLSLLFRVAAFFTNFSSYYLGLCAGFTTSHVMPFVAGEPVLEACCRTNIGGYHVTDYFKQLLSLKYPHHMNIFSWLKADELKREHCYVSQDHASEVQLFQIGCYRILSFNRAGKRQPKRRAYEPAPSAEEIARKASIREKKGQRLRDMAAGTKSSKISELENELHGLEFLLQQLSGVEEADIPSFLSTTGYVSKQEIESAIAKVTKWKIKPEPFNAEKYPIVDVPDNMLTQDQVAIYV
ncbi:hypothetical protein MKX03_031956 [Papaver bracteatum]|nr:hypothetical protein MKX03_031956 [Papaver bracteatum]